MKKLFLLFTLTIILTLHFSVYAQNISPNTSRETLTNETAEEPVEKEPDLKKEMEKAKKEAEAAKAEVEAAETEAMIVREEAELEIQAAEVEKQKEASDRNVKYRIIVVVVFFILFPFQHLWYMRFMIAAQAGTQWPI